MTLTTLTFAVWLATTNDIAQMSSTLDYLKVESKSAFCVTQTLTQHINLINSENSNINVILEQSLLKSNKDFLKYGFIPSHSNCFILPLLWDYSILRIGMEFDNKSATFRYVADDEQLKQVAFKYTLPKIFNGYDVIDYVEIGNFDYKMYNEPKLFFNKSKNTITVIGDSLACIYSYKLIEKYLHQYFLWETNENLTKQLVAYANSFSNIIIKTYNGKTKYIKDKQVIDNLFKTFKAYPSKEPDLDMNGDYNFIFHHTNGEHKFLNIYVSELTAQFSNWRYRHPISTNFVKKLEQFMQVSNKNSDKKSKTAN